MKNIYAFFLKNIHRLEIFLKIAPNGAKPVKEIEN